MPTSEENNDNHRPEFVIVRELLAAGEGSVSGEKLGKILGMSRVAVWAYIEKLRLAGYTIGAVRKRGYRIIDRPEKLDETLLRAELAQRGHTPSLVVHANVDSTNSEAERLLAGGADTPLVVVSRAQARGRG